MDVLRSAAPYLAYGFVSLTGLTSRIRWVGLEHLERLEDAGSSWLYAFWHQRQVFFTYTHRGKDVHTLVSQSRDGEMIARVMELSRIDAVRGSSSRGAAAAAREMLERARRGHHVAVTPDGPKGPARTVKPGILYLARESGLPIIPIANATSRRLEFAKAWDRFQVPLPFSRAFVVHGAPVRVGAADDLEAKARELKEAIDRVTDEADRLAGRA